MPPTGQRVDPYRNQNFLVEIEGVSVASFQECTGGLSSEIDVTEYREGGYSIEHGSTARKLPGMTKYTNITLKRGQTDNTDLYDWHRAIVRGDEDRRSGSIILMDHAGEEAARWNFVNAWPSKWTGPDFTAQSTDLAIETLELVHEGIVRV